jgi:hypothetical protein
MKKITLLFIALFSFWQLNAQVSSYSFVEGTGGVLDPMASSTQLVASASDDGVSPVTNIGFTFNYAGVDYTEFSANANGNIRLGATAVTSQWNNSATNAETTSPVIMAYWDDLATGSSAGGGKVHYVLTGTAPNRKLIVEWFVTVPRNTTGAANAKFQCVLNETTNVIEFVYGTGLLLNTTNGGYTIGLATSATLFNNVDVSTNTVSQSVFKTDNTVAIPEGTIYTWTPPTCSGSTGLTTTDITANSATVTWTPPSIVPANGYEYVVSSSATAPTGSGTPEATNSVSISSLTSNTVYYVYVRSVCGNDFGNWVSVGTFKTLCDPLDSFVVNFEGLPTGTGNLPDCWERAGTSTGVYTTTGSVAPMSPANRLYMNIGTTTTAFALLPNVSNLQADTHRLRFKAYATSANKSIDVGYFTDPSDVSTFVAIQNVALPSTTASTATEFSIVPTAIPVGVTRLVLSLVNTAAFTTAYIDDVKWEVNSLCAEPNTLTAINITNVDALLEWVNGGTASEFEIEYGAPNFTLGTGTTVTGIVPTSYTLGGLTANTSYSYYVRGVCSSSESSSWAGPFTFKTQCDDVTDFIENFDSYTTNFSSTMPDCWSRGGTSTSTYITTGSAAPMSASNRLYMFASGTTPTEGYAILPPVSNLAAGTHRLKFKAYATAIDRIIQIGYLTDAADVTTFVQLEEVLLPSTNLASTQEIIVIPAGVPTGVRNLAILNPGYPGSSTTAYIDDVAWEPIPDCANPTLVNATAVTSNSAIIGWTGNASDVTWEIEYGAPGFTLGDGTIVPAPTNPFTLTSLTPETEYQFYVRAVCASSTSTSSLSGSFTTACAAITPDYSEDFGSFLPNCWARADAGDLTTGPTGTGTGFWYADGFANNGFSGATSVNLYLSGRIGWLVSPFFDLTLGGYRVRYDVAAANYGSTTAPAVLDSDDKVQFVMSTDGGATWTSMETYNTNNIPTVASTTKIYNLPTTSANVIFAFLAEEGATSGSADWEFFIDNFVVETPPATAPSCATNIVGTPDDSCGNFPFNISWDPTPTAIGYKISVGTTMGGTDIENDLDLGLTTSYSYATPNINTTYYYTVKPYNTVGDATGCVEQSLLTAATGCYCPSEPTSNDDMGITNVQLGTTDFPTGDVTYFDHTATQVDLSQGISNNVKISFATGYTYDSNIWIDFNDNFTFESSEIVYSGTSLSANPTILDASFIMPASAPIGVHRMRIGTADSGQETPNPCYSGSYGVTLDFSVNIVIPSCSPAAATATLTPDCANAQFYVDVDVTDLGSGTPSISDGTVSTPITATGMVQVGPFADGSSVTLTLLHGTDSVCDLGLGTFTYTCPPANDDCANAIVLVPGGVFATNSQLGSNVGATSSTTEIDPTCAFYQGGDVWYSVVIPASGSITLEVNTSIGGLTDMAGAAYTGTCGNLTQVGCNDSSSSDPNDQPLISLTSQTPGSTIYFRVWEYGNNAFGTFNVSAYDASLSNDTFDNANFVAYPNPVKDVLNLSYSSEMSSANVINLLGQVVLSKELNNTNAQLDLTSLQAGTYLVQVTVDNQVKTIKIVKQ